jgi:hypothetical protein
LVAGGSTHPTPHPHPHQRQHQRQQQLLGLEVMLVRVLLRKKLPWMLSC